MASKAVQRDTMILLIFLNLFGLPGNYAAIFGGWVIKLFDYLAFLLEIYLVVQYSGRIRLMFKDKLPYVFWAVITVMSLIVTKSKGAEVVTCVRLLVTILFARWLAVNYRPEKIVAIAFQAQVIIIGAVILYTILAPGSAFRGDVTDGGALRGIFHSKNNCGGEMSFGLVLSYIHYKFNRGAGKSRRQKILATMVLDFILLAMTLSTGPLLVSLITVFFLWKFSRKRFNLGNAYVLVSGAFLVVAFFVIELFAPVLAALGKSVTLTGRTLIWGQVVNVMLSSHTWTGFGYGMFWREEEYYTLFQSGFDPFSWFANMTAGAHNTLLELWLNIGLIGIAAYLVMVYMSLRKSGRIRNAYAWNLISGYMIYYTFYGLTERGFMVYDYRTLFLFLCLSAATLYSTGKHKRKRYEKDNHAGSGNSSLIAGGDGPVSQDSQLGG